MTNLRDTDEDDLVIEMIQYASESFNDTLLPFYNQRLLDDYLDETSHTTILQLFSRDRDLNELSN